MAWLLGQKRKNIYYDTNLIKIDNLDININKFYNNICFLDNKTLNNICKYFESTRPKKIYNNKYDINEIFDEENNIIKSIDDYNLDDPDNENLEKLQIPEFLSIFDCEKEKEYCRIQKQKRLITAIGGGNKILINPLGKIVGYLYYIKN